MRRTITPPILAVLAFCLPAAAQQTVFTYQGELADGGVPATGFYDLQFTLFDAPTNGAVLGVVTNIGTAVDGGLFTVGLDFGAGVFDGSDRWLEIGAVVGGGGAFTILSPRQHVTATPYAIWAANAASSDVLAGQLDASQLVGTISSNNIGAGSISSTMLADGAVTTAHLADQAVTGDKIAPNLREGTEDMLTGFQAAFTVNDPDGSGLRVTGTLTYDASFSPPFPGISGVVVDDPALTVANVTSNGFTVGRSFTGSRLFFDAELASAAMVNSRPAMAFTHRNPSTGAYTLRYSRAEDTQGSSFPDATVVDDTATSTGWTPSLALVGGRPAIAYYRFFSSGGTNQVDLRFVISTDINGASWDPPVTILSNLPIPNGLTIPSLAEVGGVPAIAFGHPDTEQVLYVRSNDADGLTWATPVVVDPETGLASPKLLVVDNRPALAFGDVQGGVLEYVRADDAVGSSWPTPTILDFFTSEGGDDLLPGARASMRLVNGHPAIAYEFFRIGTTNVPSVAFIRASNPQGTAWGSRQMVHEASEQEFGTMIDLRVIGSRPAIAFTVDRPFPDDGDLLVAVATDVDGTAWGAPVLLNQGQVPARLSESQALTMLDVGGAPGLCYYGRALDNEFCNFIRLPTDAFGWAAYSLDAEYPILARVAGVSDTVRNRSITTDKYAVGVDADDLPEFEAADLTQMDQGQLLISGDFPEPFGTVPTVEFDDPAAQAVSVTETGFTAAISIAPIVLDAGDNPGTFVSVVDLDGLPAVAYYAEGTGDLRFVRALNATADNWSAPVVIDSGDHAGRFVSMAVIAGHPAVAYYRSNGADNDLLYRRALDPLGASWDAPFIIQSNETFSSAETAGYGMSLVEVADAPAVCYFQDTAGTNGVQYRRAVDPVGTAWAPAIGAVISVTPTGLSGLSMAVVNGRPAIAYPSQAASDYSNLRYVRAQDSAGGSWGSSQLLREGSSESIDLVISFIPFVVTNGTRIISYDGSAQLAVLSGIPHVAATRTTHEIITDTGETHAFSTGLFTLQANDTSGQNWPSSSISGLGGADGGISALAQLGHEGRAIASYHAGDLTFEFNTFSDPTVRSGSVDGGPGVVFAGGLAMVESADGACLAYRDQTNQRLKFVRIPLAYGSYTVYDDTVAPITAARALEVADASVTLNKLDLGGASNQVLSSTGTGLAWVDVDLQLAGSSLSVFPGGNGVDLAAGFLPRNQSTSYDAGTLTLAPGTLLDLEGVVSVGGPGQGDNDILKFDGLAESLFWNENQSRFEITDDLYASGIMIASDHQLQSAQNFSYNIAGNAMVVRDHGETYFRSSLGYIYQQSGTATISVFGELNLPEGATITGATFYYYDNSGLGDFSSVTGRVRRRAFGSTTAENVVVFEASPPSGGVSTSVRALNHSSVSASRTTVSNNLFQYWIFADVTSTNPGDSDLRIYGFRVTYTLQTLLP